MMKFVTAALVGACALLLVSVGIAGATSGGGASIATAPVATPGVLEPGSTSTFSDPCGNGYEFWKLPLEKGDRVKITWGAPAAVDTLVLWTPETVDADHPPCLYDAGSHWSRSPLLLDSNGTAGTTRLSEVTVSEDGVYPLLFLNTTGANTGSYSFTAVVLHAASVSFAKQSAIPGAGTFTAAVLAPDSSSISDSTLKLTLNGYWGSRAGAAPRRHVLATATPSNGLVTFDYSLPAALWDKKIRLDITGGSATYQPVASQRESVKVLVPTPTGPLVVSSSQLTGASKALRQPIYWAGPRKGYHYEFTRTTNGNDYVRYLPHGVKAGGRPGQLLIVGTYRLRGAYAALKKFAKSSNIKLIKGPHGSILVVLPDNPKSVYVAFPKVNYEIEVYDPSPKVARTIAASVRPVR